MGVIGAAVIRFITLGNVTVNQHQSAGLCFMVNDDDFEVVSALPI